MKKGVSKTKTARGDNLMMEVLYLEDVLWSIKDENDFSWWNIEEHKLNIKDHVMLKIFGEEWTLEARQKGLSKRRWWVNEIF